MGVLDKLMFWRKKTVEFETDIEGCFTLPGAEIGTQGPVDEGAACEAPDAAEALSDEGGR